MPSRPRRRGQRQQLAPPEVVPRTRIGEGLLPPALVSDPDFFVLKLGEAYAAAKDDRQQNFTNWHKTRLFILNELQQRYRDSGLRAAAFYWDALWERINKLVPSRDPESHVQLVRALTTSYQDRFNQHILDRLEDDGNVHVSFGGPTGMGKSSAAGALADWIKPIPARDLLSHFSVDLADLPRKLADKKRGDTVVQDEFTKAAGEGASTVRALFENLEDTLRATGVNLIRCSPREQEAGTMQCHLELILWDPPLGLSSKEPRCRKCRTPWRGGSCGCGWQPFSVFLCWINGVPMGLVALPWMKPEHYAVYRPWKAANVERSKAGVFKDRTQRVKTMMRAFADERFVAMLVALDNKPGKGDLEFAYDSFLDDMMSIDQMRKLVSITMGLLYKFKLVGHRMPEWFGVEPNEGFKRIAELCYEE